MEKVYKIRVFEEKTSSTPEKTLFEKEYIFDGELTEQKKQQIKWLFIISQIFFRTEEERLIILLENIFSKNKNYISRNLADLTLSYDEVKAEIVEVEKQEGKEYYFLDFNMLFIF